MIRQQGRSGDHHRTIRSLLSAAARLISLTTALLSLLPAASGLASETAQICSKGQRCDSQLEPFEVEADGRGLYGYRDQSGEVVIRPRFMLAQPFNGYGVAAVVYDGRWIMIDHYGEPLLQPFVVDNGPDPFREGLARFVSNGRFGYFDRHGRVVIPPRYDYARPFSNGEAEVCLGCVRRIDGEHFSYVGGRWGVIDLQGQWVTTPGRPPRAPL